MKLHLAALALPIIASLAPAPVPPDSGNTWIVQFGDPAKDSGTEKITVTVKYQDANSQVQTKEISASIMPTASQTPAQKKEAVQAALDAEIAKPENQVNGEPLLSTGGTGNSMTLTPSADSQGNFSNAKIDKVETEDSPSTGEKDRIVKPFPAEPALGIVTIQGDITGQAGGATPFFAVTTSAGDVSVTLRASMTKLQVLEQLRTGLLALGAKAWLIEGADRQALYVLLEDDGVGSLGAGTNDDGLGARVSVTGM